MSCPVSWLRLELFALDELPGGAREEVAAHLATCAACRDLLHTIEADARPLPDLPAPGRRRPPLGSFAIPLAAAALAAGWLLYPQAPRPQPSGGGAPGVKGGDVALLVVRERDGEVVEGARAYRPGDRLQAYVTCPPGDRPFTLTVDGSPVAAGTVPCGNQVPAGGAFALTGPDDATVCVAIDSSRACTTLRLTD